MVSHFSPHKTNENVRVKATKRMIYGRVCVTPNAMSLTASQLVLQYVTLEIKLGAKK